MQYPAALIHFARIAQCIECDADLTFRQAEHHRFGIEENQCKRSDFSVEINAVRAGFGAKRERRFTHPKQGNFIEDGHTFAVMPQNLFLFNPALGKPKIQMVIAAKDKNT